VISGKSSSSSSREEKENSDFKTGQTELAKSFQTDPSKRTTPTSNQTQAAAVPSYLEQMILSVSTTVQDASMWSQY